MLHEVTLMNPLAHRIDELIVVDSALDDYASLFDDERLRDLSCRRYATGEEALRQQELSRATLWMVNLRLPDISGVALLGLLRQRVRRCPVFLIADAHSPFDELEARAAGASAYLCKPVNGAWLKLCRDAVARPAIRRGAPLTFP